MSIQTLSLIKFMKIGCISLYLDELCKQYRRTLTPPKYNTMSHVLLHESFITCLRATSPSLWLKLPSPHVLQTMFIVVVLCWSRWSTKQEKGREIIEEYDRKPNRSSWLEFYLMLNYVVIEYFVDEDGCLGREILECWTRQVITLGHDSWLLYVVWFHVIIYICT